MENSKQNDMFQIKNLIKEFNNNIIQINEKIIIINNIITQINNILNNNKDKVKQIENFMEMMNNFKMNPNDYMFQLDKKFEPNIKKIEKIEALNEEGLEKEAIETIMEECKCTREEAIKALRKHKGDPVEALLDFNFSSEKKDDNSIKKEEKLNNEDINEREFKINLVVKEGYCTREEAIRALEKNNWDPVMALLDAGK